MTIYKYLVRNSCRGVGFLLLSFLLASCEREVSSSSVAVDVPLTIALGGVHGYVSDTADVTRASSAPMRAGVKFRVLALQRSTIVGQADYTVKSGGVTADGAAIQLPYGKYKFIAYSYNTSAALPPIDSEGSVDVTDAIDLLFAEDASEFQDVGTDPVLLSFTFVPQRTRLRVALESLDTGAPIASVGSVTVSGVSTSASFSLIGKFFFNHGSPVTKDFSKISGSLFHPMYLLPTSTASLSITDVKLQGYQAFSLSALALPRLLPGMEKLYTQNLFTEKAPHFLKGANCFVLEERGAYMIDASIKGNGKQVIIPTGGHSGAAAAVPATAEEVKIAGGKSVRLLWTGSGIGAGISAIENLSYNESTQKISFIYSRNSLPGNEILALYDGLDGTGNILWSWHLWAVPRGASPKSIVLKDIRPASGQFSDGSEVLRSVEIMDRDLGLVRETHSFTSKRIGTGTLYQWGRKDPFISSPFSMSSSHRPSKCYSAYTVEESVQNPTTIVATSGNWATQRNDNLWGGVKTGVVDVRNGISINNNVGGEKTIYDPCPLGWKVPSMCQLMFVYDRVGDINAEYGMTTFNYCGQNDEPLTLSFWYNYANDGTLYEDLRNEGTNPADRGYGLGGYWTSDFPVSSNNSSIVLNWNHQVVFNAPVTPAHGLHIRCVKE